MMKDFCRQTFVSALGAFGAFPVRSTEAKNIKALLESLHPRVSDKPLIRFGPPGDGGYLIPDDLDGIEACFSPGVSFVSGFEKACADRGMDVYLADNSVDSPADQDEAFHFSKKFIGTLSNERFMTLDDWVVASKVEPSADLLLQIDIEGYEYEVFLSLSEALLKRFRIIVVEFHSLTQLWNSAFFSMASRSFEKILQTHSCVHIHPNNVGRPISKGGITVPPVMEFTFLRNDRIIQDQYQKKFPHPLDYDNTTSSFLTLPKCWYRC